MCQVHGVRTKHTMNKNKNLKNKSVITVLWEMSHTQEKTLRARFALCVSRIRKLGNTWCAAECILQVGIVRPAMICIEEKSK